MEPYETELSDEERRQRRKFRRLQPRLRDAATVAGLFSECRFSRCRRAKECLGRHPDAEIGSSLYKNFPPCVINFQLHKALADGLNRMVEAGEEALRSEGRSPQEIARGSQDYYNALCNADDWPEDPLAGVNSVRDQARETTQNRAPGRKRRKALGKAG